MNNNSKNRDEDTSSSEDDDSVVDESEIDNANPSARKKRGIAWCGVDTESPLTGTPITWPPDPSQLANASWKAGLRPTGGPVFGSRMQLFSKTSHNLAVSYDRVYGTEDDSDPYTHLEIINAGRPGSVRIYGMLSNTYISIDKKGRLYPESNILNDGTVWEESAHGVYNTYLSLRFAHLGWYLGLKKSGKFKNGKKTGHKQKACLFLPRRGKFE